MLDNTAPVQYYEYYSVNTPVTFKRIKEMVWYIQEMLDSETDPILINEYSKELKIMKNYSKEFSSNKVVPIY